MPPPHSLLAHPRNSPSILLQPSLFTLHSPPTPHSTAHLNRLTPGPLYGYSFTSPGHNKVTTLLGPHLSITLQKPVGKGASCVVYRGFDKEADEMVAIKVVSIQKLNPKNTNEMKREIELLRTLKDQECIINLRDYEVNNLNDSLRMPSGIDTIWVTGLDPRPEAIPIIYS